MARPKPGDNIVVIGGHHAGQSVAFVGYRLRMVHRALDYFGAEVIEEYELREFDWGAGTRRQYFYVLNGDTKHYSPNARDRR